MPPRLAPQQEHDERIALKRAGKKVAASDAQLASMVARQRRQRVQAAARRIRMANVRSKAASIAAMNHPDAAGPPSPAPSSGGGGYVPQTCQAPQICQADPTDTVECPTCLAGNSVDARFCDQCSTQLEGNPDVVGPADSNPGDDLADSGMSRRAPTRAQQRVRGRTAR